MKFKSFKYKKINSTNNTAINLIKKNKKRGIVLTYVQKKGKGQRGNKWISMKGNFFSSIFFNLKNNYPTIEEFTLINPLLIIEIIQKYSGIKNIYLKRPNDIYIDKKKICGILQEVINFKKKKYLIIGIGINVVSNPNITKYNATNIFRETGRLINLDLLLNSIIQKYELFFDNIDMFNFSQFVKKNKKIILN